MRAVPAKFSVMIKLCLTTGILYLVILACRAIADNQESIIPAMEDAYIAHDTLDVFLNFVPSGWMGDGELGNKKILFDDTCALNPHSRPYCTEIAYRPGPSGWAGIYWQNKYNNWGTFAGYDLSNFHFLRITFWARGENGGEIVEFGAGGIAGSKREYKDSFNVSSGRVILNKEWRQYQMDLKNANLSNVIGGFYWVASSNWKPDGLVFYLDDVRYESAGQ